MQHVTRGWGVLKYWLAIIVTVVGPLTASAFIPLMASAQAPGAGASSVPAGCYLHSTVSGTVYYAKTDNSACANAGVGDPTLVCIVQAEKSANGWSQVACSSITNIIGTNRFDTMTSSDGDRAAVWSELELLRHGCHAKSLFSTSDLNSGNWLTDNASPAVGFIVSPSDGNIDCNNGNSWFTNLLSVAGLSPAQLGTDTSIATQPNPGNWSINYNALVSRVETALFGSTGAVPKGSQSENPDQFTYQMTMAAFTQSPCKAARVPDKNTDPAAYNTYTGNKNAKTVSIFVYDSASGAAVKQDWFYNDQGTGGQSAGYGLPFDQSPADGQLRCSTMAQILGDSRYAQAMVDMVKLENAAGMSGAGDTGLANDTASTPSCENKSGISIAWLICGVIKMMDGVISWFDTQIQGLLYLRPDQYNNANVQKAWAYIRNFSLLLLVPLMMFMVISTALDYGPFDSYTVKKMLPRMAIATILIVLSYQICVFAIEITNALGTGILNLVTSALSNNGQPITLASLFNPSGSDGAAFGGFALLVAGAGLAGALPLDLGIAFSLALTVAGALLVAFISLVIRQVLLIAAIIMSSFAIFDWATGKGNIAWKIWYETFSKLLIFFPLIMVVIAAGRGFAALVGTSSAGILGFIIKLVAYIAPYFFFKTMFSAAGGVFTTLTGAVNDRSRGFFDRNRKYRQGRVSHNWGNFKTGHRGITPLRGIGEGVGTFAESDNKTRLLTGRGWGEGRAQQRAINATRWAKTERAQAVQEDDDHLRALTFRNEKEAMEGLRRSTAEGGFGLTEAQARRAVTAARASGGFGRERQEWAAKQLFATGTGYSGKNAAKQVAATVARVAGQNGSVAADILGYGNFVSEGKGRYDLKFGAGQHIANYEEALRNGGVLSDATQARSYATSGISFDGVSILRGKPDAQANIASGLSEMVQSNDPQFIPPQRENGVVTRYTSADGQRAIAAEALGKIQQGAAYAGAAQVETVRHVVQEGVPHTGPSATETAVAGLNDIRSREMIPDINPATGLPRQNPDGSIVMTRNPAYDPEIGARQQAQRRGGMNDPNNPYRRP